MWVTAHARESAASLCNQKPGSVVPGDRVTTSSRSDIECKGHGRGRVHETSLADCSRTVFVPGMARPRPVVFRKAVQSPTVILFVCTHSYTVLEFRCPIANSVWTPKDAPPRCEELLRMLASKVPVDALIAPYRALPSRPLIAHLSPLGMRIWGGLGRRYPCKGTGNCWVDLTHGWFQQVLMFRGW